MPLPSKNLQSVVPSVNRVPSESADRSLQAVTDAIASHKGALEVSSALSGLYLDSMRRIVSTRAAFDRARELEGADDPRPERLMRAARLARKDEHKFLDLIDQAARGLCDCLCLKSRGYLETIAELTARSNSQAPEALRRQNRQYFLLLNIYQKALLFKWDLPAELLQRDIANQLELLSQERTGSHTSDELRSSLGATSKGRLARRPNSPSSNDVGSENANDETK
jgi:hypothetical protein